jgi:hypothetical protein
MDKLGPVHNFKQGFSLCTAISQAYMYLTHCSFQHSQGQSYFQQSLL